MTKIISKFKNSFTGEVYQIGAGEGGGATDPAIVEQIYADLRKEITDGDSNLHGEIEQLNTNLRNEIQKVSNKLDSTIIEVLELDEVFDFTLADGAYVVLSLYGHDIGGGDIVGGDIGGGAVMPRNNSVMQDIEMPDIAIRKKASILLVTNREICTLVSDDGVAIATTINGMKKWEWKKWEELGGVSEEQLSLKQDKEDPNLNTTNKTIVGSINELYSQILNLLQRVETLEKV